MLKRRGDYQGNRIGIGCSNNSAYQTELITTSQRFDSTSDSIVQHCSTDICIQIDAGASHQTRTTVDVIPKCVSHVAHNIEGDISQSDLDTMISDESDSNLGWDNSTSGICVIVGGSTSRGSVVLGLLVCCWYWCCGKSKTHVQQQACASLAWTNTPYFGTKSDSVWVLSIFAANLWICMTISSTNWVLIDFYFEWRFINITLCIPKCFC